MPKCAVNLLLGAAILGAITPTLFAAGPTFWTWAKTPPMGWNSYDAFGDSVTEDEVLANAQALRANMLRHGYDTVVVDYRWYDPGAHSSDLKDRAGARLAADGNGRLVPAPNRFPSAVDNRGFRPLADRLHGMGLRFGIHVMRGIPRQSVAADTPIEGSTHVASEAADTSNTCPWNPDMFGVNAATPAGQAWYDSILRLYAAWGVDYIKVDDLSEPYSAGEIEAIRRAIDRCGRPIVFSLSPGPTPLSRARHVERHANLWRISGDFWDRWEKLDHQFLLIASWVGQCGPGHWPDADMIPFGHVCLRCFDGGPERTSRFTPDEEVTLMTLWSLASSPLMLGMNLPDNDAWTQLVISNDEVLAVDQDQLGSAALPVLQGPTGDIWVKPTSDGGKAVGFFNRGTADTTITFKWANAGLKGRQRARDLWLHKDLGASDGEITVAVRSHGAVLLKLIPDPQS